MLDPDMPAQQMRLHMGEMTAQEMRTARAAIRWANSALSTVTPAEVGGLVDAQTAARAIFSGIALGLSQDERSELETRIATALEAQAAELAAKEEDRAEQWRLRREAEADRDTALASLAAERAALAEARKALEPFAKEADGRKSKGLLGGVIFTQDVLLAARRALTGGEA